MSTAKKSGGLKGLSIKRLAAVVASVLGEREKVYKDKNSAIKAIAQKSKQAVVLGLVRTGGVSVDEIVGIFGISRTYARDIISKLVIKGEKIKKNEDGVFV